MSAEEIKALARRWLEEWNNGEAAAMAAIDKFCAADVVRHRGTNEEIRGIENYKQSMSAMFNAYSDIHFTVDDMVAEGDKIAIRYTWTGTHKATNKKVTMWQIDIARIVDGKVVETWERGDTLGFMQQLGIVPTPKREK